MPMGRRKRAPWCSGRIPTHCHSPKCRLAIRTRKSRWQRSHDDLTARVTAEEMGLDAEMQAVRSRLARAAAQLREEEEGLQQVRLQLATRREVLADKALGWLKQNKL